MSVNDLLNKVCSEGNAVTVQECLAFYKDNTLDINYFDKNGHSVLYLATASRNL